MNFFNIKPLLILVLLLSLPSVIVAQTHVDPKPLNIVETDTFLEVLNGIDTLPTKASLIALSPKATLLLEQRGCDLKTNTYARSRAISFLSMFEKEGLEALTRLTACAIPETQERAIYTLARSFPTNKKVIQRIQNFNHLNSKTSALWSIRALRWISPKDAKPTLLKIIESNHANATKLAKRLLKKAK